VLYVCGHSGRGRNGNKTAFQSHGIWLARHGYICLMVDTLQLGEIAGIHHGTYRENRWWWLSRGYTPAGVECWNGVRGIDYLVGRPDVDPERIAVTGISGGGAATLWIAAADERVKVAIPVSGMADLESYLSNRVINGHCDCMFLYNAHQWHWTTIAGLIAPRPLLFVNSDQDPIFPMDANERIINRLERLYSLFGKSDLVDSFVSVGGHDYRQDIRQGTFRFLNTYLKNDPRPVEDTEIDLVGSGRDPAHPISPEQLRVFPQDDDIPMDARNGRIDQEFVPFGDSGAPANENFDHWRASLIARLREATFNHFPERIPAAEQGSREGDVVWLNTEPGIRVRLLIPKAVGPQLTLKIAGEPLGTPDSSSFVLEPRGIGGTRWTVKNPPNYVARSHYLLGRTVDAGRVWDIIASARYLRAKHGQEVTVTGEGAYGVLAMYAALLEPEIGRVEAKNTPGTLMDSSAPVLLNALRVCDIPTIRRAIGAERMRSN
jgi:dienelactone hydrolase